MLIELHVAGLATIDEGRVRFGRGLNVLTGETGAGKSVLLAALDLLTGGKADGEAVRAGKEEAVVEGLFASTALLSRARELGLPAEGEELLVRRVVARLGRGRITVNGGLATIGLLGQLFRGLVDVAGQHAQLTLQSTARHLPLLDAFGRLEPVRLRWDEAYDALVRVRRRGDELRRAAADRASRSEFLEFQLAEFDALQPREGEEASLGEERRGLAAAEKLRSVASEAEQLVASGEGSAQERLATARRRLTEAARLDGRLAPALAHLEAACAEVDEGGRALAGWLAALDGDPERLATVDDRLDRLRTLARRHGVPSDALPERRATLAEELSRLGRLQEELAAVDAEERLAGVAAVALARELGAARSAAATRFSRLVTEELGRLGMPGAIFSAALRPIEEGSLEVDGLRLAQSGGESVEFLLQANPGEPLRPLAKVASGGELSRSLLAIRCVLAEADPVAIHVFDEADAGIGGATARAVGRLLRTAGRSRQVLCVTHLPQVAACADVHLVVEKEVRGGRTRTRVRELDEPGRLSALAAMLSGDAGGAGALAAARELREAARSEERTRKGKRAA